MRHRSSRTQYLLLLLFAAASTIYYGMGVNALSEEWFHAAEHAAIPFDFQDDGKTLGEVNTAAKNAGLAQGDQVEQINGKRYSGRAQFIREIRSAKAGSRMDVSARSPSGRVKEVRLTLKALEGPDFGLGGYVALLSAILFVPALGLGVGYWVVAAKPRDLNAWLVLVLLSFPEIAFGNLDWSWRPGFWYMALGSWNLAVGALVFPALLWFGFYFPERWRVDVRWPWIKWVLTAVTGLGLVVSLQLGWLKSLDASANPLLKQEQGWHDRISGWADVVCVLLFLISIFDKVRTASTADARRRLRVLAVGSGVSLAGLLLVFGVLPNSRWTLGIAVLMIVLFPLTLAYVVVVQRAMDVRILLRMGTKYALAKATLVVVQLALGALLLFGFIIPTLERNQHRALDVALILLIVAFRVFVMRDSFSKKLQRWLDRRFFREAYNAELVLSELSEHARRFTEKGPLIDTVAHRISEILHVPQIAVWLRGGQVFHLQQAVGFSAAGPLLLLDDSATVENLTKTNRPATIYRDRPEAWLEAAGAEERQVLAEVKAELLLALPGRERLMGVMSLGAKRSEEAYTPADLRMLQSVATQTGLALEVSELAHSLANEAAQRERMNREIEIAREVQQRLFPQRVPEMKGVSLAGMCRPALAVGGDYYDFIEMEDGRLGLAIGDVSGKGISAALLMASLRASLRGMTLDGSKDLAKTMQRVNQLVYEASSHNRYATFFFATYDPATGALRYVNAGHNPPVLMRAGDGSTLQLETGGLVVGLLSVAQYQEDCVMVKAGDVLLTYTDGISEAMTSDEEEWGEERMTAAAEGARKGSAEDILQAVFRAADDFTAGAPQHDDMTLLVMKLKSD